MRCVAAERGQANVDGVERHRLDRHSSELGALLRWRAHRQPDRLAFRELHNDLSVRDEVTYASLLERAERLEGELRSVLSPGACALVFAPTSIDYLTAVLACALAGAIAVSGTPPYAPSARAGRHASRLDRLRNVLTTSRARALLGPPALIAKVRDALGPAHNDLACISTNPMENAPQRTFQVPPDQAGAAHAGAIAMLQYTSGSTSDARGVILRHANLMANLRAQAQAFAVSDADIGVSWLPLYHDLGLISGCLLPLYVGFPCILMAPASFAEQPRRWLACISAQRATISWAPAFAYGLCAREIAPEQDAALDLSAWRVALTGAEPISPKTARAFSARFAGVGLRPNAFFPCYGLAEATLAVTAPEPSAPIRTLWLDKAALGRGEVIVRDKAASDTAELLSCGRAVPDMAIAIVDPKTRQRLPANAVGEIWLAGPSCAAGYFGVDDQSTFDAHIEGESGGWLRTGDLGFVDQGDLFIAGRLKDIIIVRGVNYYPHDFEITTGQAHAGLRADGACAIPATDANGHEALVLVCERAKRQRDDISGAAAAVRRAIYSEHHIETFRVVVVPYGALPRTPSGKLQRRQCRALLEAGALPILVDARLANGLTASAHEESINAIESWVKARLAAAAPGAPIARVTPLADLGLTSLQITEIASEIETRFGHRIPAAELFEVRFLSEIVERLMAAGVQ
jgi:acyl-CoA synthetase (AMP-forming)/AMP-acid ligase II/acyl carrier protein